MTHEAQPSFDDTEMIMVQPDKKGNGYIATQGSRVERGSTAPEAMSKILGRSLRIPTDREY
ncbi:hypothetical protein COU15_02950 [Candidatus Kaiserbacteria bacterium CG10_big_fil_rev_8_21_14_0_10_45_20]|uniref:Uncharacterized protein n=1 Tax=Candidatus Kaiserbacteria bacterium CG10_big_fil_rev_8_21_14_0_10_45_20 TaxID=1974607 RepID=A0A2H0UF48_9BACT|nr:MAG: hypothetical protein COU15_02950 [Candidatus Kaiserbacteria bacterium CG10_big_fil_rev_8_21_14_0_10_45_20]